MAGPDGFLRLLDLCDIKHGGRWLYLARDGDCCHLGRKNLVLNAEGEKDKEKWGVQCWFNLNGVLW
jgi:hypothetical protein